MDSSGPRMLLLPSRASFDPACGSSAWSEDLDTDEWFGGPQTIASIRSFPGTNCWLKNGYDVIVLARRARRRRPAELNKTVQKLFALPWVGNILVVKRGFRERGCALNITQPEVSLINSLIERWIQLEL
ncbi:hypothetical protein C2E23DRAFT_880808 [Lenzites betulinus]|nr:hypothetical protein C2E23DRAFT_880808 [Lenzites betulinus]